MTEFPGYLPWHVAGDPWFTYDEIEALKDALKRRAAAARRRARAQSSGTGTRGPRRGRGRR